MTSLKWILMAFTALNITACAFDKNSNADTQQEIEDRAALQEKYNRVTGVYSGKVIAGTGTQLVELSFYTVDKKKGDTADGQPKYLPVLMTRFRILNSVDTVNNDIIMEARYIEETSEVFMSDQSGSLGIHAIFSGETLNGDITQNGGRWGTLQTQLTSRESSAPNDTNSRAERDARLKKLLQPIVGVYAGKVSFSKGSPAADYNARVTLVIGQVKDKDGFYMPALQGSFTPQNSKDSALTIALNVDYKPDVFPAYLSLVSYDSKADYTVTISGTISNGVITGDFSNKRGHTGTVRFVKE